ncbi:OB-fold domain-containing protein [Pseudooceanicola sp.]|uniref:Zn-ribbon domain-containing OB-fold protein n=1 Tax=Pseudooceanicola sp. TaxID=1914328 RepID=UPI00261007E0|nr:OB-fold domain-containing protein [Pseudooceanicola sp.]MDF1856591.1 OB-fold domain-containing protein [Pseudooceanicola sp.]
MTDRILPIPTPETRHFWEGTRIGELRLQRCIACDNTYFPPRPFCPDCGSRDVSIYAASGRGALHSYIINHIGAPGMKPPFAVAIVELEEGPRMMANIHDCPQTPEALVLDMPLEVSFEKVTDEITLPQFKPAKGA